MNADQFQLMCRIHVGSNVERCQYIAQYQPYVVEFRADTLALSYEDFIGLVKEIDQRVTSCLGQ